MFRFSFWLAIASRLSLVEKISPYLGLLKKKYFFIYKFIYAGHCTDFVVIQLKDQKITQWRTFWLKTEKRQTFLHQNKRACVLYRLLLEMSMIKALVVKESITIVYSRLGTMEFGVVFLYIYPFSLFGR